MTGQLPKHHDFAEAERWMQEAFGYTMAHYIRLGDVQPIDRAVRDTVCLFDHAGIRELIEKWKAEDRASNRGRKSLFSETSLLMVMFASMRWKYSMSIMTCADLMMRLTRRQREAFGITEFSPRQEVIYGRIWEAIQRLRLLTDRHPGKRWQRPTHAEYKRIVAARNPEQMKIRHERMRELTNNVIYGSVQFLPRDVRRRFKGSVAIDATPVELTGAQKGEQNIRDTDKMCVNYDGGWYTRQGDHDGSRAKKSKRIFAWEIEFAVMTRNHPEDDHIYPLLFLATGGHKPGQLIGEGLKLAEAITSRGLPLTTMIADRAYLPGAKAEDLQLPLAKAGVRLVMDYKSTELGIQAFYTSPDGKHNLIMVAGSWYLSCMPKSLVLAEEVYRKSLEAAERLDSDAAQELIRTATEDVEKKRALRRKYRLKPRGRHDDTGARQYLYPEFPEGEVEFDPETGQVIEIVIPGKTVKVPGAIGKEADGKPNVRHIKYGQEFEFGTSLHASMFAMRNTVENGNSRVKDVDREALHVAMKRRVRGPWFAELVAAFAAATQNLSRILDWLQERLALANRTRMNRNLAAVYEDGYMTRTVEDHDRLNPFEQLESIPILG
jgi:hypothetical protein